jgi:uncharacterized protein YdhG (YjbR/CyaY superfamily)
VNTDRPVPGNIDEYIAGFPAEVQEILEMIRSTIRKEAPDAEEKISYRMPSFTLDGRYLIHFAAYKHHIGLYPAPRGNTDFKDELSVYLSGRSTVKLPLDKPIPCSLIGKIVKFLARGIREKAAAKGGKKK